MASRTYCASSSASQTLTASYQQDGVFVQTVLSPFSIHVQLTGNTVYEGLEDLRAATSLVLTDGNALPVQELTRSGLSGSTAIIQRTSISPQQTSPASSRTCWT